MTSDIRIAVTSRSFSKHTKLRKELCDQYEHVKFNDEGIVFNEDSLVEFLQGHTHAITALERITDKVLRGCPELTVLSKYGVGTDMLDFKAITEHNIRFGWTAGVNCLSVAELTISFMIQLLHRVPESQCLVKNEGWKQIIGRQLSGKTVGIIGCGHVGEQVVKMLQPYQCKILVNDLIKDKPFYDEYKLQYCELDEMLPEVDVLTLHTPLDHSTRGLIASEQMDMMKEDSILINYARGGIINEEDLIAMLEKGKFQGVALDVLEMEPPKAIPFNSFHRVSLTPHIGGSTEEAVLAMGRAAIKGLKDHKPMTVTI